jgi:signal transduction histidine kinase
MSAVQLACILGGWTALILVDSGQQVVDQVRVGAPITYVAALRSCLVNYGTWAALTPAILLLAERIAFAQRTWRRAAAVHLTLCLGACLAHRALVTCFPAPAEQGSLALRLALALYGDFWMYVVVILLVSCVHYYARYCERDVAAAHLGQELARAELQALRNQINPHLLFNALNSVAALMHEDVQAADDMLNDLGQLLRACLSGGNRQETHLREEIDMVRAYVNIQKHRFADRLSFVSEVDDDLLDAHVPSLLLQPLVENAIVHGIAPRAQPGCVRLSVRRSGHNLAVEVCDDGLGMAGDNEEGIGLSNTRARLRRLHGSRQTFEVRSAVGAGVTVRITLPLRFGELETGGAGAS